MMVRVRKSIVDSRRVRGVYAVGEFCMTHLPVGYHELGVPVKNSPGYTDAATPFRNVPEGRLLHRPALTSSYPDIQDICDVTLLAGKVCHDAAILRPAGLGLVAGDRLGLAVAFGDDTAGIDIEGCADV